MEFAIMMDRPRNLTVAKLILQSNFLKVAFISLPSGESTDQVEIMINSFIVLKDLVLREDYDGFCVFFSHSSNCDRLKVWDALQSMANEINFIEPDLLDFLEGYALKCALENDIFVDQVSNEIIKKPNHFVYPVMEVDGLLQADFNQCYAFKGKECKVCDAECILM